MNLNDDGTSQEKNESEEYEDYFGFINNNDDEDRSSSKLSFSHEGQSMFLDKKSVRSHMEEPHIEHEETYLFKNINVDNEPPFKKYKANEAGVTDDDNLVVSPSLEVEVNKRLENDSKESLDTKDDGSERHAYEEVEEKTGSIDSEHFFRIDTRLLWNKREYYYRIDRTWGDRIWDAFVSKKERKNVIEKDINEDAFYSGYSVVPSYDISFFRDNQYLLTRLSCQNLRKLNMKFLRYNKQNIIEMEEYISLYRRCNEDNQKLILKNIIIQKRKLMVLYNKIRNYMSEIILLGEDCHNFLEKAYHIVFKKSLPLDLLSTANNDEISQED